MNANRTNHLLSKLTAFDTLDQFRAAANGGYVPTIFARTAEHGELIRALRTLGFRVWTGTPG